MCYVKRGPPLTLSMVRSMTLINKVSERGYMNFERLRKSPLEELQLTEASQDETNNSQLVWLVLHL